MKHNIKNSPGPWKASTETNGTTTIYVNLPGQTLGVDVINGATEDIQDIILPLEVREKNIQLILCAPEMLEALEFLVNFYNQTRPKIKLIEGYPDPSGFIENIDKYIVRAEIVLKKAKGEE